jgi:Tfp pilus assembly protein PilV
MDKKNRGISIVEIMVSMVILSVVVMLMTNVMVISNKGHSSVQNSDDASLLAREKLSQLQDPSILAVAGSDTPTREGTTYNRVWTLSGNSPVLITVRVTWEQHGIDKVVEAAGYVENGNVCQSLSSNNPPVAINIYKSDNTPLLDGDSIKIPLNTGGNKFVARLVGIDPDTAEGDVLRYSLSGDDADKFKISHDSLFTKNAMTDNEPYDLDYTVVDCANNQRTRSFVVYVIPAGEKPKVAPNQEFHVTENSTDSDDSFGELVTEEFDESDITWSAVSSQFTIALDGEITVSPGVVLDHESQSNHTFPATASRAGLDSTVTVTVYIDDVNEAPVSISLSNTTATTETAAGSLLGTLTAEDRDAAADNPTPAWYTLSFSEGFPTNYNFDVYPNGEVKVKNALSQGTQHLEIVVKDENGYGLSFQKGFDITVNSSGSGGTTVPCTGVPDWIAQAYSTGSKVKKNNIRYTAIIDISATYGSFYDPAGAYSDQAWNNDGGCE